MTDRTAHLEEALRNSLVVSHGAQLSLVSSRRGSYTWRCQLASGDDRAIKVAFSTADGAAPNRSSLAQERAALQNIPELRSLFDPRPFGLDLDGELVPGLEERWISGKPLKSVLRQLASSRGRNDDFVRLVLGAYEGLSVLHRAGWTHGDLQPDHLVVSEDGIVRILDYGRAQGPGFELSDFRGGLVHFNSPEVARSILVGERPEVTPRSDVFALAAAVYYATFEELAANYRPGIPYSEALLAISEGTPEGAITRVAARFGQPYGRLFGDLLSLNPLRRPESAVKVADILRGKN